MWYLYEVQNDLNRIKRQCDRIPNKDYIGRLQMVQNLSH